MHSSLNYYISYFQVKRPSSGAQLNNQLSTDWIQCLLSAPVLSYPNDHDPFIFYCDVSGKAIGVEVLQIQEIKENVIGYYSNVLSPIKLL